MSTIVASTKEVYQFSATPKTVKSRSKYRESGEKKPLENEGIRNDVRVRNMNLNYMESTPQKAFGKSNRSPNKEIEEITASPYEEIVREKDDETKLIPDYYVDRAPTPEYKPLEPGVDVATQIEDTELFDFILEVEPVLQVLVGKTLEQAQTELREEDERTEEKRHKMAFEKKRNAELMVTQRKEALHIRKQEEIARREKQRNLQKEESILTHQKYISRLLAKNTTHGMLKISTDILNKYEILNLNMKMELKKDYIPYLLDLTQKYISQHNAFERNIQEVVEEVSAYHQINHAAAIKTEFDRRKKIADDKKAEEDRLAAEKKHRRERRRKLRLNLAKTALLEKIQVDIVTKPQEIESAFAVEISDLLSATNEPSVNTIGGLLGELWLILDVLQSHQKTEIKLEEVVQIFVSLFGDKLKARDLPIYLMEDDQHFIQEIQKQMEEDLINFNQNKTANIEELAEKIHDINHHQSLRTVWFYDLLEPAVFKQINKALLYILFSSVDYKIPEKKPVQVPETKLEENNEQEEKTPEEKQEGNEESAEQKESGTDEQKDEEKPKEETPQNGQDKPKEETLIIQEPEEEFKLPEITLFEQTLVELSKKIKVNYVKEWEKKECNSIVRFRNPLHRIQPEENKPEEQEEPEKISTARSRKKEEKPAPEPVLEQVVEEQLPQETFEEKMQRLIVGDEFIEPYDGSTFEKEQAELPEMVPTGKTFKVYNTNQLEGKHVAQINERGQRELRKELLTIVKECVPEWKELVDEEILPRLNEKYSKNEKAVLGIMLGDSEEIPIFDIESI